MATVAAGETAGRNTTGTRIDLPMRLGRGAVVAAEDCFAIVWQPVALSWLALPLALQHGPLHRSHVILAPDDVPLFEVPAGRLLIRTSEPFLIDDDARVIGSVTGAVMERIARTILRAGDADSVERFGYARP